MNKWHEYEQLYLSFPKTYEVTRDKDASMKSFYRRGTYRIAAIRDGDYQGQAERNTIIKKLENSILEPRHRDMPY